MSNQKGFSKIAVIIIVLILVGGFLVYTRLINKSSIDKYQPEPPTSEAQQQSTSSAKNNFSQKSSQTSQSPSISDNFKSSGELNKSNSVWNFTARKYDPKTDNWNVEGPYRLKFTDNSMCQSVTVESRKCANFIFTRDNYNPVEIRGTKKINEIIVSSLVIIQ